MRLDLFLKKTMIIKRRVIAKEIVERGNASINNKVAKPSSEVKDGDIITLKLGKNLVEVKAIILIKNQKEWPNYDIIRKEGLNLED
jgi:ribosomal 50S subunit-recycling heat shock protein